MQVSCGGRAMLQDVMDVHVHVRWLEIQAAGYHGLVHFRGGGVGLRFGREWGARPPTALVP